MLDKNSSLFSQYVLSKTASFKLTPKLIDWATNNRVLLSLILKGKNFPKGNSEEWVMKLTNTLKYINDVLPADSFLVTRTFKYFSYVTFDVDVFVQSKDFKKTIQLFKKNGCTIESHDSSLGGRIPGAQMNIRKEGLLTIDLHQDFTWQKRHFLDTSLLFKNTRERKINGIKVVIPSAEVEFLLCMSDIGHERFNITMQDIIWLEGLSKEIKQWNLVFKQAEKHGWKKVFDQLSRIINQLSVDIYKKKIIPAIEPAKSNYSLPYFVPLWICWLSYIENCMKNKYFPITSFAYMHYTRLRYFLSNKKRMPYYTGWYKS